MPEENLVESPYVREIRGMGHRFVFQVVKLWEIPAEVLKQTEFEVLLPLLPLTQAGKSRETVDDMICELVARDRPDLLALGHHCAGLIFTDEIDKQWLKERFSQVQNIFEESWVYQETIQKGREEGLEKGLEQGREEGRQLALQAIQTVQQAAIGIVAERFPELEDIARAAIATISDLNRLQMLIIELSASSSLERTKRILHLLGPSA